MPSPTDVSPLNPGIVKQTFNVPGADRRRTTCSFTIRGDNTDYMADVIGWLGGSNIWPATPVASPALGCG